MKKNFVRFLSALAAMSMLVSLYACKDSRDTDITTEPDSQLSQQNDEKDTVADNNEKSTHDTAVSDVEDTSDEVTQTPSADEPATSDVAAEDEKTTADSGKITEKTTAKNEEKTTVKKSDAPQTKAEIISYCNKALNAVKSEKAGFTKKYVRNATGEMQGLPDWIKNIVKQDKTSTVKKGENSDDIFPAAGFSWSSKLRESDVKSYKFEQQGKYYIINLYLGNEKNPAAGETSTYGRCMSVVTVSSAESIPGVSNADMDYHDGHVYAKIDSKTGRVVECEFSAAGDITAKVAVIGQVTINNIVSSETFTNFVW